MSVSQGSAIAAIGLQLVQALDGYELGVHRVVHAPLDADKYAELSALVDRMRMYAGALPRVSVAWVELLIRHFELAHGLWRVQQGGAPPCSLVPLGEAARAAAVHLRRQCVSVVAGLDGAVRPH